MPRWLYKSVNDLLIVRAMHVETEALVVAVRAHGEHGAVVRALTADHGMLAGYVRGGRSRRLRPVLIPGNRVRADFRARTDTQLAALTVELVEARAALMHDPLAALALGWSTALVAATLPEGQAYPRVHQALDGMLIALESAPSARGWLPALVRFEQVVLAELGYGEEQGALQPSDALRRNGERLARDLLGDRRVDTLAARERLVERLGRAVA